MEITAVVVGRAAHLSTSDRDGVTPLDTAIGVGLTDLEAHRVVVLAVDPIAHDHVTRCWARYGVEVVAVCDGPDDAVVARWLRDADIDDGATVVTLSAHRIEQRAA